MKRWHGLAVAAVLWAGTAGAWGPQTESAIVTGAARLLSKETALPLTNLLTDIRAGAQIADGELLRLIPEAEAEPVSAIADQMHLLEAVRSSRIDPYYAYRLGVLGKLVATVSGPMPTAQPVYRDQYFSDVEERVQRITLQPEPRRIVEPAPYFTGVMAAAAAREDLLVGDYKSGVGFGGIAKQSLASEVSRSVNAVGDVWFTILSGEAAVANISQDLTRRYYVDAVLYFIERGYEREAAAAYERLEDMGVLDLETRLRIADIYYDAGFTERAVEEYQAIVAQQPGRRDAVERLSRYYVGLGDAALDEQRLYDAQDAYQNAVDADPLNTPAKEKLVNVETAIAEREDRLNAARGAVEAALAMERQAEELAGRGEVAEALATLKLASQEYASVTAEFPEQQRIAQAGRTAVSERVREMRRMLLEDAQEFSGLGASSEAVALAVEETPGVAERALEAFLKERYEADLQRWTESAGADAAPAP